MLIVDSQIHIWENDRMSAHHRQIPTYSKDDALKEMAEAGVDLRDSIGRIEHAVATFPKSETAQVYPAEAAAAKTRIGQILAARDETVTP